MHLFTLRSRPRVQKIEDEQLDPECKFTPELSEKAKELASQRNVPLLQRFQDLSRQREEELERRRAEQEEEEMLELKLVLQVGESSLRLLVPHLVPHFATSALPEAGTELLASC